MRVGEGVWARAGVGGAWWEGREVQGGVGRGALRAGREAMGAVGMVVVVWAKGGA